MKKLIITPSRLNVSRLSENERYITNGFWMIDKTYMNEFAAKFLPKLKAQHAKAHEVESYNIPLETCQKVIDRGLDGQIEVLTMGEINYIEYYDIPLINFISKDNKITKVNAYFVEFMKKLGAVTFEQTQSYSYQPIIARNEKKEVIGVIMPIRQ